MVDSPLVREPLVSITFHMPQNMTDDECRKVSNWVNRQLYMLRHHPEKINENGYTASYARFRRVNK